MYTRVYVYMYIYLGIYVGYLPLVLPFWRTPRPGAGCCFDFQTIIYN